MDVKPLLVDRQTAKAMLGNIGDTKLYSLLHRGEIEGRFLDNKRLFTVASIEALAARLSDVAPPTLAKRNSNMRFVTEAAHDAADA